MCTATVLELKAQSQVFMLACIDEVLLVAASSLLRAELVIENPRHLTRPEQQAQVLFQTTARVWSQIPFPDHWPPFVGCFGEGGVVHY
jgi:hypothetical protein